ncbi:hypothetical protein ACFPRL_30700 [Pseudoclavibacter helvolus]
MLLICCCMRIPAPTNVSETKVTSTTEMTMLELRRSPCHISANTRPII